MENTPMRFHSHCAPSPRCPKRTHDCVSSNDCPVGSSCLFVALIEAALWCLPVKFVEPRRLIACAQMARALRTNTRGTQAYHRLRLELAAPLLLIFLLGNAAYQTIDQTLTPVTQTCQRYDAKLGIDGHCGRRRRA